MSYAFLEYTSWSFQLIIVLVVLYLVVGLIQPSWVLMAKRRTIVVVSVVLLLLASTAFYVAVQPVNPTTDGASALNTQGAPASPRP